MEVSTRIPQREGSRGVEEVTQRSSDSIASSFTDSNISFGHKLQSLQLYKISQIDGQWSWINDYLH